MDNLLSKMASFSSTHSLKGVLRELTKLLSIAAPNFNIKQLLVRLKYLLDEENIAKQEEVIRFMNRVTQAKLIESLNAELPLHPSKDAALLATANMEFTVQHFALQHNVQALSVVSSLPEMEYQIYHQLGLASMCTAFEYSGFRASGHRCFGMQLMMVTDEVLDQEGHEQAEKMLIFYPHLRLLVHTTWDQLEFSLNPHVTPRHIYSQSQLLEGQGLFRHHELLLMLLHILAASQLAIAKELHSVYGVHTTVDGAVGLAW